MDSNNEWQKKEPIWHEVLVFGDKIIEQVKNLRKGDRFVPVSGVGGQYPVPSPQSRFAKKQPNPTN